MDPWDFPEGLVRLFAGEVEGFSVRAKANGFALGTRGHGNGLGNGLENLFPGGTGGTLEFEGVNVIEEDGTAAVGGDVHSSEEGELDLGDGFGRDLAVGGIEGNFEDGSRIGEVADFGSEVELALGGIDGEGFAVVGTSWISDLEGAVDGELIVGWGGRFLEDVEEDMGMGVAVVTNVGNNDVGLAAKAVGTEVLPISVLGVDFELGVGLAVLPD